MNATEVRGVLTESGQPLSFANVLLKTHVDSSLVKFTYSDDEGGFSIDEIAPGKYFLHVVFLGLDDYFSEVLEVGESPINLGNIELMSSGVTLQELTITATKPLLEVKPDMLVLNVENSVLASGDDVLNLLRKAPGVLVDNNDRISVLGKSGTIIYIDGKISPLRGDDLVNYLRNLSSDDIESIEIISNPSAKYDAQGTAGIINIKRKKSKKAGINGGVNASLRQGLTFGSRVGANVSYRKDKINIAANAGASQQDWQNFNDIYRIQNGLGIQSHTLNNSRYKGYFSKINLDYYLNDKSTFGLIGEYNDYHNDHQGNSLTRLGSPDLTRIDSLLINDGTVNGNNNMLNLNANYTYKPTKSNTLEIDLNTSRYNSYANAFSPNAYYTPDRMHVTSRFDIRNITPTTIKMNIAKLDYEHKFNSASLSVGLKSTHINTDNTLDFYNIEDGVEILNMNRSNQFVYSERVQAAYGIYQFTLGKLGVNSGLRMEYSNTLGELESQDANSDKSVKREYLDFFPSLGISYRMNDKHSFQLSLARRINRPDYSDLNPFEFQLDELTFQRGNAFLNPEYTNSLQITHNFNSILTSTLSYSHTDNVITQIIYIENEKGSNLTWDNLAYRKIYSASVSSPINISNKWNLYTSLNASHTQNRADFDSGRKIDLSITTMNTYHQQTLLLGKGWSTEVSGWYQSPSIWESTFVMNAMWAAGAGISKKFANDQARIVVNIDDIFKTNVFYGSSLFGGLNMNVNGRWDSRRVRMSFSYNFGSGASAKSRNRDTGLDDVQSRLKQGN